MSRIRRNFGIAATSKQIAVDSGISERIWEPIARETIEKTWENCNPDLVALIKRIEAIADSADPAKTSVPAWYYDGQNPLTGSWFTDVYNKEGEKNDSSGLMWGMIHGAQAIGRLAKWKEFLPFLMEISGWVRGLPCLNPSNDPNYLENKVKKANDWLDTFESGHYCLNPDYFPYKELNLWTTEATNTFVKTVDENTGEAYSISCKGPISWGLTKERVKAQYFSYPWRNRRGRVRPVLDAYKSAAEDLVSAIYTALPAFRSYIAANKDLVYHEEEMGVNADFKVELTRPFLEVAEGKIEETISPPVPPEEGGYEETADYSFFYKIAAGVFGVAGGVIAGKAITERLK